VPEFPQFPQRIRLAGAFAAVLLLAVFFLPRGGLLPMQLLFTVRGLPFVQLWFLALSGLVLGSAAALPVPELFRSGLGVAALAVWLPIGPLPLPIGLRLGIGGVAALLCAALLIRSHMPWAQTPRKVGIAAVVLCGLLYLWPFSSVLPIRQIWLMLTAPPDPAARFIAIYLLLPIPVALLSTLVFIGGELAALGETLAWLVFMWGPGALLIQSIDLAQIYTSLATLATLLAASYGLAEPLQTATLYRDGY
jgi:hypothetical protein